MNSYTLQAEARKDLLEEAFSILNGKPLITVGNYQNFYAYMRTLADGSTLINATNLNFDIAETIKLRLSFVPKKIELLNHDGTWQTVNFRFANNEAEIEKSLSAYDCAIIKVK